MKNTLLLASLLIAGNAFAQPPAAPRSPAPSVQDAAAQVDARFAAWLGCWRLDDDLSGSGARLCITPEKGGVRLQTIVGTQRGIDELVIPDGVAHPIADADCKGTERAEWSTDGARIFRTTGVECGKELPRSVRSVVFMAPGPALVNVQHVSGQMANTNVRVQRYRRAFNQKLADGSTAPQPEESLTRQTTPEQTTWSVEDVIEASSKMPVEVIQAALTELHHPFQLNKKTLLALDDNDVPDQIIDLMVALSYPKKFRVERMGGGSAPTGISTGTGWFDPMLMPTMMGAMADCYAPYGYGYRSYYSLCGSYMYAPYYGYGYGYYNYGGYYGGWVDVGPYPPIGGSGGPAPIPPDGRAINGRGYTQIRDRDAEPAPRSNRGGGNGTAAGWSGNSGGNATSGGYSSGSSGSSSGGSSGGDSGARIAVPKGGGGR